MPIDDLAMLEFLADRVMEPATDPDSVRFWRILAEGQASYFDDPIPEAGAPGRTLGDLVGARANLLLSLAQLWQDSYTPLPAEIVRDIETFLFSNDWTFDEAVPSARRLLDYVYPVV